jgi:hypothetical protein
MYTVYPVHEFSLQISMPASGISMHYVGWAHHLSSPQEIHGFKWEFVFHLRDYDLRDIFQGRNFGLKRDLLVFFY